MLDEQTKNQLIQYFSNLKKPVTLHASLDDGKASQEMLSFLEQITPLSSLLTLRIDGQSSLRPSFKVVQQDGTDHVEFAAIPMGHELTSFVLAVLWAGGHPPKVDPEQLKQVKSLHQGGHYTVVMSLSCHNCPDVVQAFVLLATFNPLFRVTVMDGSLFQDVVDAKGVLVVPAVFQEDTLFASGRMELGDVLAKLDTHSHLQALTKLSEREPYQTLVVGAGPAGAAAAVYLARKGLRVTIVGERSGGQLNDTVAIENYLGMTQTDGSKLANDLMAHVKANDVEILNYPVKHLIPSEKEGGLITLELDHHATLKSRSVIIATGAQWRNANVPGEQEYRNKGVAYCPHCDGPLFKNKRVAVLGGGNSGVEAAIDLAGITDHVDVLEFADQLKADQVLIDKLKSLPNVTIYTMAQTTQMIGDGHHITALEFKHRETGELTTLPVSGIFVQIGLVPNSQWLDDIIERNRMGEIVINERCETSVAGIFAAGDVTTVPYKQIIIAAGEGAKAALSAFDYLIRTTKD